jgi:hypothetical protein
MPAFFYPWVEQVGKARGDGHCGFRSLAVLFNRHGEEDAHLAIRKELVTELDENKDHYLKYVRTPDALIRTREALWVEEDFGRVSSHKWMIMGDHGPMIANRYQVLVCVITPNVLGCETFVPAIRKADPANPPSSIFLSFTGGNHFVPLKAQVVGGILPIPPLSPMLTSNKAIPQDIKDSWVRMTKRRTDAWLRIFDAGNAEFKN